MNARRALGFRFLAGGALALAALLGTSGITLADSTTGQTGDYLFTDDSTHAGATCVYSGNGPYRLTSIVVRAPSLWWPDTNSNSNTQHGKVDFKAIIQRSLPGTSGPWHTVMTSTAPKATAYEDHPAYDPSDKAPLTKQTVMFDPSGYTSYPDASVRVTARGFWFRPNGSTLGTSGHVVQNYLWKTNQGNGGSMTACPIHFAGSGAAN